MSSATAYRASGGWIDGDILNIDMSPSILDGYYGDTSRMYIAGSASDARRSVLIDVTYEAMMRGVRRRKARAPRWATSATRFRVYVEPQRLQRGA